MRRLHGKFEGFSLGDDGYLYRHGIATFPILGDDGKVDHTKCIAYKLINEDAGIIEAVELKAPEGYIIAPDGLPIRYVQTTDKTEWEGLGRHV